MSPNPLRVAMVSEHASPLAAVGGVDAGGQNIHVAALSSALATLGVEVAVYTRRDGEHLPPRVELAPGVTVVHVTAGPPRPVPKDDLHPYMGDFATELGAAMNDRPPDIVHAHFWMSGEAALAAAEPLGIPVVQTFHALGAVKRRHQGATDTSPPERLATERAILGRANLLLATCSDEARELTALGAAPLNVTIIPCGVDLTRFWPEGRVEPRRRDRARVVVVGRLVPRKGMRDVLAALARLDRVELVIAGGPERAALVADPEARALLRAADEHGVADRVELRGRVAHGDLPALYRSADVVVCAPWYEPFGIVPLEAMGCGVPVVATAVGGLLDTVVDGVTGVLVPPRQPDALAAAMADLLADPARRAAMGAAATRRARLYSWRRIAAATLHAYEQVVAGAALTEAVSQ
jgi:D-inositol-3-phosphate glycosyltransferase